MKHQITRAGNSEKQRRMHGRLQKPYNLSPGMHHISDREAAGTNACGLALLPYRSRPRCSVFRRVHPSRNPRSEYPDLPRQAPG